MGPTDRLSVSGRAVLAVMQPRSPLHATKGQIKSIKRVIRDYNRRTVTDPEGRRNVDR